MAEVVRLSSFADLVPFACVSSGYVPVDSVWARCSGGLTMMSEVGADAPVGRLVEWLRQLLRVAEVNAAGQLAELVVFGPEELMARVEEAAVKAEVVVPVIVRYLDGRVWVHRGGQRVCGAAMDLRTHPIALAGIERGVVLMSRAEQAALWTVGSDVQAQDSAAIQSCLRDLLAQWGSGPLTAAAAAEYAAEVGLLLDEVLTRPCERLSAAQVARLAAAAQVIAVRDHLLGYIVDSPAPERLTDVWRAVARRCLGRSGAAAAVVGAVAAYSGGRGSQVNMALDAAVDADPEHSLAALLIRCVEGGLPPEDVTGVIRQGVRDVQARG